MSQTIRWVGFGLGILVLIGTMGSVISTLVVPRALPSKLVGAVGRVLGGALRLVWRPLGSYHAKDRLLALHGPLWVLGSLFTWVLLVWVGYALVDWPFVGGGFENSLREAGSSLLTLGFAATESVGATAVDFLAAATGLVVVALLIAYLPVLYGAFNRREGLVTMLESRAGLPAWGPEIIWRHHRVDSLDNLPSFFAAWEEWCADVAETHTTYPFLVHFRSPHHLRSWITGLLAVLDAAALYNALCPRTSPTEARMCLRMGFVTLRAVADGMSIPYDPDPMPDTPIALTYNEYVDGVEHLMRGGFETERTVEEAWPHFRGWRVNYEAVAYAIADRVVAAPGPWSGPRRDLPELVIPPRRPADRRPEAPEGYAGPVRG